MGLPGSSGLTWSMSWALSSTISSRLPATRLRYSAALACRSAGISVGVDAEGGQEAAERGRRCRWGVRQIEPAQVDVQLAVGESVPVLVGPGSASAVLPMPPAPASAEMTTVVAASVTASRAAVSA